MVELKQATQQNDMLEGIQTAWTSGPLRFADLCLLSSVCLVDVNKTSMKQGPTGQYTQLERNSGDSILSI